MRPDGTVGLAGASDDRRMFGTKAVGTCHTTRLTGCPKNSADATVQRPEAYPELSEVVDVLGLTGAPVRAGLLLRIPDATAEGSFGGELYANSASRTLLRFGARTTLPKVIGCLPVKRDFDPATFTYNRIVCA